MKPLRLHNRAYHLLWMIWPKRNRVIEGNSITYVQLPKWLLCGGRNAKRFFAEAMVLTHRPSSKLMIFVSRSESNSKRFRYSLYHEYLEGNYYLTISPTFWTDERKEAFKKALNAVAPEDSRLGPVLDDYIKKPKNIAHAYAIVMELALAKKEMDRSEFLSFLDDAIRNRF